MFGLGFCETTHLLKTWLDIFAIAFGGASGTEIFILQIGFLFWEHNI